SPTPSTVEVAASPDNSGRGSGHSHRLGSVGTRAGTYSKRECTPECFAQRSRSQTALQLFRRRRRCSEKTPGGSTSKKRDPPSVPARAGRGEENLGAAPDERERSLINQKHSTAVRNWHRLKITHPARPRGISRRRFPSPWASDDGAVHPS